MSSRASLSTKKTREPLGHLMLLHLLRDAGFTGEVTSEKRTLEKYATDESIFHIAPQVVIRPQNEHDVEIAVKVVAAAAEQFPNLSLTPRAAGTGLSGGSLTDSVVVDMEAHLNRIERVTKVGGRVTFTAEPGAMWRDVEKALKKYDHYLPCYPASKQICTIGGAVANNSAGPDSLRYGHVADWVESLRVVLRDGKTYTVRPLSYKDLRALLKHKHAYAELAEQVFRLIEANETAIERGRPKTKKNSAGYALWDVISTSVKEFKKGKGVFDLTRLFAGSQGTIGIITKVEMRAEPINHQTSLVVVPVFDLSSASKAVVESLKYDPINVEVFDALTFEAAMRNPQFFRDRIPSLRYYQVMFAMYTTYHIRWRRKLPEFTMMITLDNRALKDKSRSVADVLAALKLKGAAAARHITNPNEREMFWQVRDASYLLSKLLDPKKRPAAFLEDMTVPPEHMARFFAEIKFLLKKFNVIAAVHGHGGNGHFHFYPLLDFTNRTTPALVMKMSEEFFNVAVKYHGNICGEHNDGIIRTPHLSKIFSPKLLKLFVLTERLFDPDDIFNPGKKVNPRFDVKASIRHTN